MGHMGEVSNRNQNITTNFLLFCAADVILVYLWEMNLIKISTCWDRWAHLDHDAMQISFATRLLSLHIYNPLSSKHKLGRKEHHFYSLSSFVHSWVYGNTENVCKKRLKCQTICLFEHLHSHIYALSEMCACNCCSWNDSETALIHYPLH